MINPFDDTSKDKELVDLINEIIISNLGNTDFNISNLKVLARTTESKLYSVMREYFNESPNKYLLNRRLDQAMILLQDYQLNISQISYKVGINNASTFSTSFKKRFGKTPSEVMSEVINKPRRPRNL